jgi:hypothetical protein
MTAPRKRELQQKLIARRLGLSDRIIWIDQYSSPKSFVNEKICSLSYQLSAVSKKLMADG